jgi:PAS domain S-box-containing protein
MSPDHRISRLVSGSAAALTALALILPPTVYFFISYQQLVGSLEAVAELNAVGISHIISVNPDLWEYEQVRFREYLVRRPRRGDPEQRRVLNLRGEVVAESVDPLPAPLMTKSYPLMDAGAPVGSIEVTRSLRPVVVRSSALALVLLPLSFLAFRVLRTVPLRAVRRSEAALRRQRDAAQQYLDVAGVAFVILDRGGRVGLVNRKGTEILGRSEAEVIGRDWVGSFVDPADRERVASRLAAPGRRGDVVALEYAVLRPSGEQRIVSWYVTPLTEEGRATGLLASGVDISAQRQLEAQLGHAQKLEALGALASGVAHDFNNILTVVKGYAQQLQAALPEGDANHAPVGEILAASDRAAALTQSLLTFSRRQEMRREPLDLVEVVRGVQRFLRHLVRPDIEIRVELPTGPLPITGDLGQLEQVLMNLVTNARDAMPRGGRITMVVSGVDLDDERALRAGLEDPGPYAQVAVSDTGVGMDWQTRARLFEPFFTTKDPGKGTGLGLAIAYGIVKKHQGSIGVTSEPGRGATFTFLLPIQVATARLVADAGLADLDAAAAERALTSPRRGAAPIRVVLPP